MLGKERSCEGRVELSESIGLRAGVSGFAGDFAKKYAPSSGC